MLLTLSNNQMMGAAGMVIMKDQKIVYTINIFQNLLQNMDLITKRSHQTLYTNSQYILNIKNRFWCSHHDQGKVTDGCVLVVSFEAAIE